MTIYKIISGGQTGVDRAALDAAIKLKIPHGGWCPKGRLAENGSIIPEKYSLKETESVDFSKRTKLNIRDSDGTLVLLPKALISLSDGTTLTIKETKTTKKPLLIINLGEIEPTVIATIVQWINKNNIEVLNIAGPRESQSPDIYNLSLEFLQKTLPAAMLETNSLTT